MPKYEKVIYARKDQAAKITLNDPEKLNALDFVGMGGICDQFLSALDEAENDDDVKVVIIGGAGRAFCVGRDLSKVGRVYGMPEKTGHAERRPSQRIRLKIDKPTFSDFFKRIFLCPKITLAQVHGPCLEGGFEIMSACDLAVVAENARIGRPGQRLGGGGCGSDFASVVMTIGLKRALKLFLLTEPIDGKEAERIGLVTSAVPEDKLEEEVARVAQTVSLLGRDVIAIGKARRHLVYERLGLEAQYDYQYIMHSFLTNVRWEPDEFVFFKGRRDKGVGEAIRDRDKPYKK